MAQLLPDFCLQYCLYILIKINPSSGTAKVTFLLDSIWSGISNCRSSFRGLCCDWLLTVMHLSYTQIARYVGDEDATIRKKYINKKQVYDGGAAVDESIARDKLFAQSYAQDQEKELLRQTNAELRQQLAELKQLIERLTGTQEALLEQHRTDQLELKQENKRLQEQLIQLLTTPR
jgi:chromosome segregation ATPase